MPAYKDNKTGKWYCQFRYTEWTGEVKQKRKRGFALKREAEQWERDFLEQHNFANKKKTQQCTGISFGNFVQMYFDDISVRKTTARTKLAIFENHILPYLENLKMDEITPTHITRWQQLIIKKKYSPSYLNDINKQLAALFNHAERYYGLQNNPCNITPKMGKNKSGKTDFLTLEEYQKILAVIPDDDYRFKLAYETLFWSGCRVGELLALKPNDFTEKNMMRIDEGYAVVDGEEIIGEPKTEDSKRTISIPDFVYNDIMDYVGQIYGITDNDRIFLISKQFIGQRLNKYAAQAGVKQIRVHDLRHSHVAYLIDNDVNIMIISKRLGHADVSLTWNVYGHLYPERENKTIESVIANYKEQYRK